MSDKETTGWEPEDGAGYIPTEERDWTGIPVSNDTLSLIDQQLQVGDSRDCYLKGLVIEDRMRKHADSYGVPKSELRELVEKWRGYAEGHTGPAKGNFDQCADELEELL